MNGKPKTWQPDVVEINGRRIAVESNMADKMVCVRVLLNDSWIQGAMTLAAIPLKDQIKQLVRKIVAWK